MLNPYPYLLNFIVIIAFVFAFLASETKGKIILASILIILLIIPSLIQSQTLTWIVYAAKIIFGLVCYLIIKTKRVL